MSLASQSGAIFRPTKGGPMVRLARVLASSIVAGLVFGCGHGQGAAPRRPSPTTVRSDDRQSATSLEQLLAGKISGVLVSAAPGGGITVRIGGPTSFYSKQDPLFALDGVPLEAGANGTLSWAAPHRVEAVTALQDPSTTAVYGGRGGQGRNGPTTEGSP